MKPYKILLALVTLATIGCVQKTCKHTVVFTVDVSSEKAIKTVGLRGFEAPLSWENDLLMQPIKKDSLYQATITFDTPYEGTLVKFTLNGTYELDGKDNRRVQFTKGKDTTYYKAAFNKVN